MWNFLIPAAASVAGALYGANKASQGQEDANKTNIKLGREQMAFQREMSNTSYQRGIKDMQAAGLNPMLAYSQGGASAPLGSMPQVQNAQGQTVAAVGTGVASANAAMSTLQGFQAMEQSQAHTEQIKATTDKIESETLAHDLNTARAAAELQRTKTETVLGEEGIRNARQEIIRRQRENQLGGATFEADVKRRKAESLLTELEIPKSKAEAEFHKNMGEVNPYLRMLLQILGGASNARQLFKPGAK